VLPGPDRLRTLETFKTSRTSELDDRCGVRAVATAAEVTNDAILPSERNAEVINFIARLRERGRSTANPTARLVDVEGNGVDGSFTGTFTAK